MTCVTPATTASARARHARRRRLDCQQRRLRTLTVELIDTTINVIDIAPSTCAATSVCGMWRRATIASR